MIDPQISFSKSTVKSRRPVQVPRSWTPKVGEKLEGEETRSEEGAREGTVEREKEREKSREYISLSFGMDDNCILHSLASIWPISNDLTNMARPHVVFLSLSRFLFSGFFLGFLLIVHCVMLMAQVGHWGPVDKSGYVNSRMPSWRVPLNPATTISKKERL